MGSWVKGTEEISVLFFDVYARVKLFTIKLGRVII
jgi:hypothetical protein